MKTKYYISGALFTLTIILLHYFLLCKDNRVILPIIILLANIPNFILTKKSEYTKPIKLKLQSFKCSMKDFVSAIPTICTIALFIIIYIQLPEEKVREIAGKWYFLFTLWLFIMSGLITKYINEKKSNESVELTDKPLRGFQ